MRFAVIDQLRGDHTTGFLCGVFDVSRSGYYEWRREAARRDRVTAEELRVVRVIEAVHLGSKRNYGSPRITPLLKGLGHDVSPRTVARLMRRHGIRSRLKRRFKVTTTSNHNLPVAANLLMQDFTAYAPGQIWMSDLTEVKTREGSLYVCGIIDLCTRRVVGWSAASRMPTELVIEAYRRARAAHRPERWLVFHSDRGSQYAARKFRKILIKHRVLQSMSRVANCWDSAPIESLWGRLKTECVYWEDFATRDEAIAVIAAWFAEYNATRPHSALGYASPAEVEARFEVAAEVKSA